MEVFLKSSSLGRRKQHLCVSMDFMIDVTEIVTLVEITDFRALKEVELLSNYMRFNHLQLITLWNVRQVSSSMIIRKPQ